MTFCHFWRDYYFPIWCMQPDKIITHRRWLFPELWPHIAPVTNDLAPIESKRSIWVDGQEVELDFRDHLSKAEDFRNHVLKSLRIPARRASKIILIKRTKGRRLLNSDSLAAALGVKQVTLEGLSLRAQLTLMQTAKVLIGYHGGGITHSMFVQPGCKVIEILPPGFDYIGYSRWVSKRDIDFVQVRATRNPRVEYIGHGGAERNTSAEVDIEEILCL